jgi:hypothetical protein
MPSTSQSTLLSDREWLYARYVVRQLSAGAIGKSVGASHNTVLAHLRKFDIPVRPRTWSRFRIDDDGRECTSCALYKPWSAFWRCSPTQSPYGHLAICGSCKRLKDMLWTYHVTQEQYDTMLAAQDGCCALCREVPKMLVIDHDHACCAGDFSCGECVRGLLCVPCNTLEGRIANAPFSMEALAVYRTQRPLAGSL